MTLEEMLKDARHAQSIALDSIGKKFNFHGNVYKAVCITDDNGVVLQDVNNVYGCYTPSIGWFAERVKSGEYAEVSA